MIRVLVVDDSATMRAMIRATLSSAGDMDVVGEAAEPHAARAAIKALSPDVVTLDVEMPGMNGLEFLEKIMRLRPTPVVMVSTLTQRGADTTLAALELGAVDCVGKPQHGEPFVRLVEIVRAAAQTRVAALAERRGPSAKPAMPAAYSPDGRVVTIGASTGGVEALLQLLQSFPANAPPTLITQHMPANFTRSFAARLDRLCQPHVSEAVDGAPLKSGQVYIAPGSALHLEVASGSGGLRCRLRDDAPVSGHRPSVDVLFRSAAERLGSRAVGVILTGMGRDGASGLLAMRQAGATTLGQDEASSLIYGMPRVAFEIGAVERQLPLSRIGEDIVRRTNMVRREQSA